MNKSLATLRAEQKKAQLNQLITIDMLSAPAGKDAYPAITRQYFAKGFKSGVITYGEYIARLQRALPFAEEAAQTVAAALGGTVIMPDEEFKSIEIELPEGTITLVEGYAELAEKAKDSAANMLALDTAKAALNKWFNKTIGNIVSFTLAGCSFEIPAGMSIEEARTRACFNMDNGEIKAARRNNPAEQYRALFTAREDHEFLNSILAYQYGKEYEASQEALKNIAKDPKKYCWFVFGQALDLFNRIDAKNNERPDEYVIALVNGTPCVPSKKECSEAWDHAEMHDFTKIHYITPALQAIKHEDLKVFYEMLEFIMEKMGYDKAKKDEWAEGKKQLARLLATEVAKQKLGNTKQLPKTWNCFTKQETEQSVIDRTEDPLLYAKYETPYTVYVTDEKGVLRTLKAINIAAANQLMAWRGKVDKSTLEWYSDKSESVIADKQKRKLTRANQDYFCNLDNPEKDKAEWDTLYKMAQNLFSTDAMKEALMGFDCDFVAVSNYDNSVATRLGVVCKFDETVMLDESAYFEGGNLWGKVIMALRDDLLEGRETQEELDFDITDEDLADIEWD